VRALLALTIALALAGAAFAQDGTNAVSDGDDSRSGADISSVRALHDRANDRLAHIIRFHGGISPSVLRNAIDEHGPPGSICVNIWRGRTPWEASPNFDVCVTADRGGDDLQASVSKLGPRGGVRRRGPASAERTCRRRLVVRVVRLPLVGGGDHVRAWLHDSGMQGLRAAPRPLGADGTRRAGCVRTGVPPLPPDSVSTSRELAGFQTTTCRSSECVRHRAGRRGKGAYTYGYRSCEVVQRREGLRLHHA
jgi:hypothetical protein